jgi:hypothetical protein
MFMKLAKECPHLIGRFVNRTDVDLVFTKTKPKLERRLDFAHFLDALLALAVKRYPADDVRSAQRKFVEHHLRPLYVHVTSEMERTGDTDRPLTGAFRRLYDVRKCVLARVACLARFVSLLLLLLLLLLLCHLFVAAGAWCRGRL